MKRFLVPALLFTLAACSQAPAPDAQPSLAPLAFGTNEYDAAHALAKHRSGVYAVGETYGNLHGANKGENDVFIRKYDRGGGVLWGRQFGTSAQEQPFGVASDAGNNAYVVGQTRGNLVGANKGGKDVFLRKYTSSGSVSWTRQFGTGLYDEALDVAVSGSNVYVVGQTEGPLAGSQGGTDGFIRKYTTGGSVAWTRQFGTSNSDSAQNVAIDGSGNVYVVGYTGGSWNPFDVFIYGDLFVRKYNASGSLQWAKERDYGYSDYARAVAVSGSDIYVVGGFDYNDDPYDEDPDVRVLRFSASGAVVWDYAFGPVGEDYVQDVKVDGGGNVYVAGFTGTDFAGTNQGGYDGYVMKLNSRGTRLWGKQVGTPEHDYTYAVQAQSGSSELYAAGETEGALGGANNGGADGYVMQLSPSTGSTVWTD